MGLIGSIQAFNVPAFTVGGSAPTVDEAGASTSFTSVFGGVGGGHSAAAGDVPSNPLLSLFPQAADGQEAEEDGDVAVATFAAVVPVALDLQVATEAAAEATAAGDGAIASPDLIEGLAGFLESAAAEADLAESPDGADGIDVSMLFPGEETSETTAGPVADADVATMAADDSPAAPDVPGDLPIEQPAARALDVTEAPPDVPPDIQPPTEESLVRPVGNAPESNEMAGTEAGTPDLTTTATDVAPAGDSNAPGTMSSAAAEASGAGPREVAAPGAGAPAREPVRMEGHSLEQVANAVVERLDGDGGEARIILDPPELGEIVIKLHARGDQVSLEIVAQRPEAIQMLRDGSPSLQMLLQDRGLDLSTAQFSLSQQGQQGGGEGGQQGRANTTTGFAQLLGFEEPGDTANRNHNRLRAAYNPDGAFAYRV